MEYIHNEGIKIQEALKNPHLQNTQNEENNTQKLWEDFKSKITKKARERAKIVICTLSKKED